MTKAKYLFAAMLAVACSTSAWATGISVKISGQGAVNDSTIKAGQLVSLDFYFENDREWSGFSSSYKLSSPSIKKVIHPVDTLVESLSKTGDVRGHNGWQDKSVWDFGFYTPRPDWDGELPEVFGFAGLTVKSRYKPHAKMKTLSVDLIFPETGVIVLDTAFFPPGGVQKMAISDPKLPGGKLSATPKWGGPYKFKVVK